MRKAHTRKRQTMISSIEKHAPSGTLVFKRPEGGFYLWCKLRSDIKGQQLLQQAISNGVFFRIGEMFYSDDAGGNKIRLCFTSQSVNKIDEGIQKLGKSLQIFKESKSFKNEVSIPFV